jgi:hypothetical protein
MKDPEQMSKHELVQTIYKLAEVNQDLVEALEDAVSGYKYIEMRYGKLDGVGWDRVYDKAKQALAKYNELK